MVGQLQINIYDGYSWHWKIVSKSKLVTKKNFLNGQSVIFFHLHLWSASCNPSKTANMGVLQINKNWNKSTLPLLKMTLRSFLHYCHNDFDCYQCDVISCTAVINSMPLDFTTLATYNSVFHLVALAVTVLLQGAWAKYGPPVLLRHKDGFYWHAYYCWQAGIRKLLLHTFSQIYKRFNAFWI